VHREAVAEEFADSASPTASVAQDVGGSFELGWEYRGDQPDKWM
jgi:hypothetical protein